ncbi:NB-ARC domain disease resistance protein [Medicago truncatula]|uniref:NB-ARC domain disease resistance protein n=1 Tax=Medicago truncatula TaxID=3880 RepID=A0A072VNI0_MEDTR|nr:NB-ARC domain disease resistance protein [Medicago truncatula]
MDLWSWVLEEKEGHVVWGFVDETDLFATSSFMAESIIYGREREKEEIIKFLFSDANQVSIISIVGLMGKGRNMFEYPNLETIGMKLVEKCGVGGLSLALKTLGILLQRKFSENEWVKILETDLRRLPKGDSSNNYSVLRMSYLSLPSNLKHCFAYYSIFPKGYEFENDGLIKLWMTEGLLKGWEIAKNEEELGNKFFNDLVSMSFFQKSAILPFWAGKCYFIVHDLINDLMTSMLGEFRLRIEGVKVQDIPQRTCHIWCCLDLEDGDRKLKQIHNIKGLKNLMVEEQVLVRNTLRYPPTCIRVCFQD